jgi:Glycosyl hydrolases family 15
MISARSIAASLCALVLTLPAAATNLVTGNGFGFAVVAPDTATITKFYAHPYSFTRPDPAKPLSEGIETANFLKSLRFSAPTQTAEYENDSHIIRIRSAASEGFVFMPFGLLRPALILSIESSPTTTPSWQVEWNHSIRSQRALTTPAVQLLHFDGIDESLLLIPLAPQPSAPADDTQPLASSSAWALVSLENDAGLEQALQDFNHWRSGLTPRALVQRELAELDHWRASPPAQLAAPALHLWRQSEVMLRIAQSREPNRTNRHSNGLIVASLPDGVWFTPWVRDMAWATVALARMGHRDEARAALLAYFNAQPTGKMRAETANADYQVSVVRYSGDGSEEPFFTEEGSTNIEFDDWGEVLWVLGTYLRQYDDPALLNTPTYRGALYATARDFIAKPLLANLEPYGPGLIVAADTSIWEERQKDKKHFAFSTAMAIVGLQNFTNIAQRAGDTSTATALKEKIALLQKGFAAAFIRDGHLHGTLEPGEKNDIDGALLPILTFAIVTDPNLIRDTLARMDLLKVASGGYRRVRSNYTDPAIFEYWYEREEFLFVDIALAEVDRRLGRTAEAAAILARITGKAAADHDIIPEMYVALPCKLFPGQIGDPTGARPMVGYGAGAYILDILDQAASTQP